LKLSFVRIPLWAESKVEKVFVDLDDVSRIDGTDGHPQCVIYIKGYPRIAEMTVKELMRVCKP
jgi:hypothetical protein